MLENCFCQEKLSGGHKMFLEEVKVAYISGSGAVKRLKVLENYNVS